MQADTADSSAEAPSLDDLHEAWRVLADDERVEAFRLLPREQAEEFFGQLQTHDQTTLIGSLPAGDRRSWMRLLAPDDAADVVQAAEPQRREALLALLDGPTHKEVMALLAYAEDDAGGLMNPRFARVRPDMLTDEAISYLRKQTRDRVETMYYVYVLDSAQKLLGVVSFRDLFAAQGNHRVAEIMRTDLVTVPEKLDQEAVSHLFAQHGLVAMPVVDDAERMKGIVTLDDIVDVVREEATEDIQKFGGMEALDQPYLQINLLKMLQKRAGWLSILLLGEMFTATAVDFFEGELRRAVVLGTFMPLIISSGGNSGSQASTLVIRAMTLGQVRLRDWWRVINRELLAGLSLGCILGCIGFMRVILWQSAFNRYGEHYLLVAATIAASLVGVVMFGTLAGATLPFIMQRLGFDPASASAPFVATLADVTGLIIYFTTASFILRGSLL